MGKLFGTDGIRGVVGETLTAELAYRVGQAITIVLTEQKGSAPTITCAVDHALVNRLRADEQPVADNQ